MNKCTSLQEEKPIASTVCEQDRSVGISNYAKILDNVDISHVSGVTEACLSV